MTDLHEDGGSYCSAGALAGQLARLPLVDQIMPKPKSGKRNINPLVAALVYDGFCMFEFACAAEVFGLPRPELGANWYRFETCSVGGRPVRGQFGLKVVPDGSLDRLVTADTIIIPGWSGVDVPVPAAIIRALRAAYARGARLLSICSGSFVLAAAGLLDGKTATTHWRYADALRQGYPRINVDPDVLYVDEGQVLTSAGSAAGLDLCLHLVRRDHGSDTANNVARRLVIPPHRDGGQAQFVQHPVQKRERNSLSPLMDFMRSQIDQTFTLAELARKAAMSERTFIRRFKQATGTTPADWLTSARVERARELLENSSHSIDTIAEQTGLGTAATLRHHFRRRLGTSPTAYRSRFA